MREVKRPRLEVEQTVVDRLVSWFDPVRGIERLRARATMAVAGQWIGGRSDRRATKNWRPRSGSADADLLFDLPALRDRSADLERNNPLALGAINTVVTSTVGTGLALYSRVNAEVLKISPDAAQQAQRHIETEFRMWAENPRACDAAATLDFYAMQELAFRSAMTRGDVFALLPMKPARGVSIYDLKIHLIEADRVCNRDRKGDSDLMAGGVELDPHGAPVAYHITRTHPGAINPGPLAWDRIPAFGSRTGRRNVVHLYHKRRVGQTRGIPYLAPVIESLKQLGDYTTAEITAAVVSGMFTVFVTTPDGEGMAIDENGNPVAATGKADDDMKLGAGAIVDLAPGEQVNFANPGRPNTAFDPFVQAILRQIGVALELPFEVLIKHFTASYSAARAALLEAWRFFRVRRAWLGAMFCQPIFEAFFEEAVARGRIDAPGFFDDPVIRAAWLGCEWRGDAPGQIDPAKEVTAAEKRLALTLTTYSEEKAAFDGGDWEESISRRGREEKLKNAAVPVAASPADETPGDPQGKDKGGSDTETPNNRKSS